MRLTKKALAPHMANIATFEEYPSIFCNMLPLPMNDRKSFLT